MEKRDNLLGMQLGGLWRHTYCIFMTGSVSLLAGKVAEMAEKLAQPFIQSEISMHLDL